VRIIELIVDAHLGHFHYSHYCSINILDSHFVLFVARNPETFIVKPSEAMFEMTVSPLLTFRRGRCTTQCYGFRRWYDSDSAYQQSLFVNHPTDHSAGPFPPARTRPLT
jgi:hypothetical protein